MIQRREKLRLVLEPGKPGQHFDGDFARYKTLGPDTVQVFMEEEKSAESEISHTTEVAAYFVFDRPGSLTGMSALPRYRWG